MPSPEPTGLESFLETLSAPRPTPGAGSAAAALAAIGAALLAKSFRIASAEPGLRTAAYMEGRADELEDLRDLTGELVRRDAEAYSAWRDVRGDPAKEEIALRGALEAPTEVAEFALAALRLFAVGRGDVPARLACELDVARRALEAAIAGALTVARENLGALADEEARRDLGSTLDAIQGEMARLAGALEGVDA